MEYGIIEVNMEIFAVAVFILRMQIFLEFIFIMMMVFQTLAHMLVKRP